MAEYIEREATEKEMLYAMSGTGYQSRAMDVIRFQPSADVVEVRHGGWIKDASTSDVCAEYRCSLCGFMYCESDPKYPPYKYCPECGAKNE